eukprot:scaffold94965_cov54-Prasinocladus_malaysianus.AAC.1
MESAWASGGVKMKDMRALQAHGTGTALGDPIEIGAATSVLHHSSTPSDHVMFCAAKSSVNHSEAAAGVMNILYTCLALCRGVALHLNQLRSVNSHVETLFASSSSGSKWAVMRQHGSLQQSLHAAIGTSSFAYMGTNAHMVCSPMTAGRSLQTEEKPLWQPKRQFVMPPLHHLLTTVLFPSPDLLLVEGIVSAPNGAFLWDHKVSGRAIFPGAGYLDAVSGCLSNILEFNDDKDGQAGCAAVGMTVPQPFVLGLSSSETVQALKVEVQLSDGRVKLRTSSSSLHAQASLRRTAASSQLVVAMDASFQNGNALAKPRRPTQNFHAFAAVYGAAHELRSQESGIAANMLDAAIHLASQATPHAMTETFVPVGLDAFQLESTLSWEKMTYVSTALNSAEESGGRISQQEHSYILHPDAGGSTRSSLASLRAKAVDFSSRAGASGISNKQFDQHLLQVAWMLDRSAAQTPVAPSKQTPSMSISRMQSSLMCSTFAGILQGTSWSAGSRIETSSFKHSMQCALPALLNSESDASGMLGLQRTCELEIPDLDFKSVLTDSYCSSASAGLVARFRTEAENGAQGRVESCSFTSAQSIMVPRLSLSAHKPLPPHRLFPKPRGAFTSLKAEKLQEITADQLPAGTMLVKVQAVGINFRDVLNVLGMYPGDPGPPGGDCSGIICAVSGQTSPALRDSSWQPAVGDSVFGLAAGCLASHVIVSDLAMVPIPQQVGFKDAATISTVYITVDTALHDAGGIAGNSTVLVHGAAGGVGLAACQLASSEGATILGTAGPAKRAFLRAHGIKDVFDSRSTSFVETALHALGPIQ